MRSTHDPVIRRFRLVLLAVIATASLVFADVAQAAPPQPPDPHTVGATTLSHIELNGVLGTEITVAPGEDVKIRANWADNNTGCPHCEDFVATAFAGNPAAGCIEEEDGSGGFVGQSGTGEVDLGPALPGKREVVAQFEEVFFCGQFWNASESTNYPVIAIVKGKKPSKK